MGAALEGVCLQLRVVLDQLDALQPVHACGPPAAPSGPPLWREVMAAALDRPLQAVGAAEGAALGAAALGLIALDRATQLADAVAQLSPSSAAEPPAIVANRTLVGAYDRLRAVPELIRSLVPVADLFARAQAH